MVCPYCGGSAEMVAGTVIYPHRPDLSTRSFWRCAHGCDAYVGCHAGTDKPLGRLANAELRAAKIAAHKAFDHRWRSHGLRRGRAYDWLSEQLGIPPGACHIAMFDIETCQRVIDVCTRAEALA